AQVAVPLVVGEDDDDVGRAVRVRGAGGRGGQPQGNCGGEQDAAGEGCGAHGADDNRRRAPRPPPAAESAGVVRPARPNRWTAAPRGGVIRATPSRSRTRPAHVTIMRWLVKPLLFLAFVPGVPLGVYYLAPGAGRVDHLAAAREAV